MSTLSCMKTSLRSRLFMETSLFSRKENLFSVSTCQYVWETQGLSAHLPLHWKGVKTHLKSSDQTELS